MSAPQAPVATERSTASASGVTEGAKPRKDGGQWLVRIALIAVCVIWTIPTLGLLISSFRDQQAIASSGWWTVFANPGEIAEWTIAHYVTVIEGGMGAAFVNSLVVAVPATVIPILAAAFAAYAFAWMDFPGREVLFVLVVMIWVAAASATLFFVLKRTIGLRVEPDEEMQGLDVIEHGGSGYGLDTVPAG